MPSTALQIDIPPTAPTCVAPDGDTVAVDFLDYDTPVGSLFGFTVAEKINGQFYNQRLDLSMFTDAGDEEQAFVDLLVQTGGDPGLTKDKLAVWLAGATKEQVVASMGAARRRLLANINSDLAIVYPKLEGGDAVPGSLRDVLQYWLRSRVVLTRNADGTIVASDPSL